VNKNFSDLATAVTALETKVSALETRLSQPSAFKAQAPASYTQSIPDSSAFAVVSFSSEDYDLAQEYDPATSTFTAKTSGYYALRCQVVFETLPMAPGTNGWFAVAIYVGGDRKFYEGFYGDGYTATRFVSGTVRLEANAQVTCRASNASSGGSRNLSAEYGSFRFEGERLPL
jgi:hypothetical protein